MINIKNKELNMSGQVIEIIEDLTLIKLTLIDEVGLNKTEMIYKAVDELVKDELDKELFTKFKTNLPDKIAKKLMKLWGR